MTFLSKGLFANVHFIGIQEGDLKLVEIKIDLDKCTGCGTCVDVCPVAVFEVEDDKSKVVNIDECIACRGRGAL